MPRRADSRSCRRAWWPHLLGALACLAFGSAAATAFRGLTLDQALRQLQHQGLNVLYSSALVRPSMEVRDEPQATAPRQILDELIAPHGLAVKEAPNGALLLIRAAPASTGSPASAAGNLQPPVNDLEEIIVSASEYRFVHGDPLAAVTLGAADLQLSPDIGDDPLRAVARLPGVATSEFSARANIRGGEAAETLVRFGGLTLSNPFHLKDFQSVFSTIAPGLVREMRIYSGGFPVRFGDRLSGVIDIEPPAPDEPYGELSLSFFNAAALAGGRSGDGRNDWLVSARRGNLDLIVDALSSNIGRPAYGDLYAHAGRRMTDSIALAANVLASEDSLVLFDSDHEEGARAEYRDRHYWLTLDYAPRAALSGRLLLARSDLDSVRRGDGDQDGVASGKLEDIRDFTIDSVQTDWTWRIGEELSLLFGAELRDMRGRYDYRDEAEFDLLFDVPGAATDTTRTRSVSVRPSGNHYALYGSARLGTPQKLVTDLGLRWDRNTLADSSDQVSPRISVLHAFGERVQLRAAWGQFFQSQSIDELQVSDGITQFFPPQQARHLIGSVEYRHPNGIDARLEAYRKDYRRIRPRFENLLNSFVLLPELKPDRIRIAPLSARASGFELTVRRATSQPLAWWLSYSRSSVTDEFADSDVPRSWNQRHLFSGGVTWQGPHWELSVAAAYHSGWPTTAVALTQTEPIPIVTAGPRNARRLHDYRSLDVRAARRFELSGTSELTLFVEAGNILNRSNDCCVKYELESEETPELTLDMSTLSYLPITPSLGVIWRF
ncbi:MAG TPA: TonB-dependent receptor [Steroidobacteraceae bacterium]|nr:TonB-dependent receptor [Steroidobacteraceae bacterium]